MGQMHQSTRGRACRRHLTSGAIDVTRGHIARGIVLSLRAVCLTVLLATTAPAQDGDCLQSLPHAQSLNEQHFDEQYDRTMSGMRFSCDVMTRASNAQAALDMFRSGVLFDRQSDIRNVIRFPLKVGIYQGQSDEKEFILETIGDWLAWKNDHLETLHLALISCSNVKTVRVYKNQGFAIGPGLVWFNRTVDDHDVKVIRINLYSISGEDLVRECVERMGNLGN